VKIIAISGDGAGAGKTYAARVFGNAVWTIADSIRVELQVLYPQYNWFDRTQRGKEALVGAYKDGSYSIRDVLTEYGQEKCAADAQYWIKRLVERLEHEQAAAGGDLGTIAVDDVRKVCELNCLRASFRDVTHLHITNPTAVVEPLFEAEALKKCADYVVSWRK